MDREALGRLLRGGEGACVEFKRELPGVERTGAALAAFSNGTGGWLVVGAGDDGSRPGVPDPAAAAAVLREAAARLLPPQPIRIHRVALDERVLLVAEIAPALRPPVRMWHLDGTEVAYVREGASTRRAEKDDLRALSSAGARAPGTDDLDSDEVAVLLEIRAMKRTALRTVVDALRRGRREGRRLLKALQRRGYLVRKEDGRFALTAFAHEALVRRDR
ncbi:MAG: ATP-binding protein [Planctomycetes bacterium]|nr:ATP-binding protein [Planctomycetota bacterium]